jgi:hypothetical protein
VRPPVDTNRIRAFVRELGREARRDTKLYLTGGASAVLQGWREATLDIDVRFERLKEGLEVNVELASPPDFVPELRGWRERSPFVVREGLIDVHHFDFYSQALAKIERGFEQDLQDVAEMLADGLVDPRRLRELFDEVEPSLFRYPAIDPGSFRAKLDRALR